LKKLIALFLTFLLTIGFSAPAYAGPAILIGAVIGGAVAAGAAAAGLIAASILTAAAIGAAVGAVAGALAPDLLGGMFDTPDYNVTQNAQAENDGILVNKTGMLESIPVVYGTRKVGGKIVFLATQGTRNKYLYMALILSEGEIESIGDIYIDDVISTDSRFANRFSFQVFTGADNQGHSSLLAEANGWDSSYKLSGLAYIACRFEWKKIDNQDDADANPYAGIPKVTAVIRGKKVKSMAGLTNSHATTYENETSLAFSNNPADCIADYLRNPRYGRGLANNRINFASFSTARDKYAQQVTYVNGNKGPVLVCDAVIDTGRSLLDNTKLFIANARSGLPYVQGRFKLKLHDTGHDTDSQNPTPNVAYTVTMDQIVTGVKLQGNGTRNHFNQVKITYIDPEQDWKTNEVIYPELNSALDTTYLAEDNGRRLTKEMAFNHIINKHVAADIASILLLQSRNRKNIEFDATAELHEVEVGDIITVQYSPLGIDTYYRVNSMKVNADYTIGITASEHTPSVYVFTDDSTIYGSVSQIKYVGDTAQTKYYAPNSDGTWDSITNPPATGNEPTTPINITQPTNTQFNINSVTERSQRDNARGGRVYVNINVDIADILVDQIRLVTVESYSNADKQFVINGIFIPGTTAQVGGYYQQIAGFPMDGSDHLIRISAGLDNGDSLPSATFTYTAPTSKYTSVQNTTF